MSQGGPASTDDVTKSVDILDSEVLAIEKVMERIHERAKSSDLGSANDFAREIRERFAEVGFVVKVSWYYTSVQDVVMPEVTIVGRTDSKPFDRDQMVHEVTNDILELGEGGVIHTSKDAEMMRRIEEGHKH